MCRTTESRSGSSRNRLYPTGARPSVRAISIVAVLALCSVLLTSGCRSKATSPVDEPAEVSALAITGPCASPHRLTVPGADGPGGASGDWQPVRLAPPSACFRMSADDTAAAGLPVDTVFSFESAVDLAPAEVEALLQADPALRFEVEEAASASVRGRGLALPRAQLDHVYTIRPTEPLDRGRVYRFRMLDRTDGDVLGTWGFQTARALSVVQTLPADGSYGVPTNTGIELTFSHEGVADLDRAWSMEPPTEGRFEEHGRTTVFVPDELLANTLYTVRVAAGVTVAGSDLALDDDFELRFETGSEDRTGIAAATGPAFAFSRPLWEAPADTAPVLSMYSTGGSADPDVSASISVYRFAGIEEFGESMDAYAAIPDWALASLAAFRVDVGPLDPALTFDARLQPLSDYGEAALTFPDELAAGWYLVEAGLPGGQIQAWLQVTDVAAYVAVGADHLLLWANDLRTGGPLVGAVVSDDAEGSWSTDEQGLAFVETPPGMVTSKPVSWGGSRLSAQGRLIVKAPDGRAALVPLDEALRSVRQPGYRDWYGVRYADNYWRYLYPDRQLYRTSDQVRFWGVARMRSHQDVQPIESITVELAGGAFTGLDYGQPVIARASVPVGPTGTFSGSLAFDGASPGFYSLRSMAGAEELSRTSVEIADFVTPAYQLAVEPDKRAAIAGDPISVTVRATFFEGSPVPGLALRTEGADERTLVTDQLGRAAFGFQAATDGSYGYEVAMLGVRPALAEEGQMTGVANVVVLPAEVTLETVGEVSGAAGIISGTVWSVDLGPVNDGTNADPTAFRGAPSADRTVTADVIQLVQERVETGTSYDFVSKRTVTNYRYEVEEIAVGTYAADTDAAGRFRIAFPAVEDAAYRATVRVTDDRGREATDQAYLGGEVNLSPDPRLQLEETTRGPYAVGAEVRLRATLGGEEPADGGSYLFLTAANGIREFRLQPDPVFAFTFDESHVPNVHVLAVRFTGSTYQEVPWSHNVPMDTETRRLEVVLHPDRARYSPGDEVSLDVSVTGTDGAPVPASVLLAAVDAAVVGLQGGGAGDAFRSSLYASVGAGVVCTYASHQVPLGTPGAEGGGGGDGRGDFRDVVLFQEIRTGADGRGSVRFTLPDNLTSWAVTALALGDDMRAGTGLGEVPVGIPLFVDLTMNREVLVDDRVTIRLRAFGEGLDADAPVAFEVSSESLLNDPIRIEGVAFEGVDVPLPALVEGRHEIRVTATSGEMFDALVRPLTVLPSRLVAAETQTTELAAGDSLPVPGSVDRPAELVITDANRGRYYDDVVRLTWSWSDRLDSALGRAIAADLGSKYFTSTQALVADIDPHVYQTDEGGAALLPYGGADLTVSAVVAAADPTALGRQGLAQYFTAALDEADGGVDRKALALAGLGFLGEPVLPELQALLAGADLAPREALMLALAAAGLGDLATAEQVYGQLLAEVGQQRGSQIRLVVDGGRDESLEASAMAAWLGAVLGSDTAPMLYQYVSGDTAREAVTTLLEAGYLAAAMPRMAAEPAVVAYSRFGSRQEETIGPGESLQLRLSREEAADLALEVVKGRVAAAVTTLVPMDPRDLSVDPEVRLSRSFRLQEVHGDAADRPDGGSDEPTTVFRDGDLVLVSLEYDLGEGADDGCYQLSDLLPSGLVPVTTVSQGDRVYYEGIEDPDLVFPYQVVGSRVSFCAYRDSDQNVLRYLARVVSKGEYLAEPALLQSMQVPDSRALSGGSTTITIR